MFFSDGFGRAPHVEYAYNLVLFKEIKVVVVLAKKRESLDIFRLVKDIDPNAFISQSNVVGADIRFDKLRNTYYFNNEFTLYATFEVKLST